MIDVDGLRRAARARAAKRATVPFDGKVADRTSGDVQTRVYEPRGLSGGLTVYFAHGGYGVFGDLDLQDGYCRRLGAALRCVVVSVDYRLAPEHTFDDAVADVVGVVRGGGHGPRVVLCGDSAGGAVAVAAAARLGAQVRGLLLTNPNLDLSLSSFDRAAEGGPDGGTSRAAMSEWVRPTLLADAPRLHRLDAPLPPAFVAVGSRDALVPEARQFAEVCVRHGRVCELHVLDGLGHGFMGEPATAGRVLAHARTFVVRHL